MRISVYTSVSTGGYAPRYLSIGKLHAYGMFLSARNHESSSSRANLGGVGMLGSGLMVGLRGRHCNTRQICRDGQQNEPPPHSIAGLDSRFIPDPPKLKSCQGNINLKTAQLGVQDYFQAITPPFPFPCAFPRGAFAARGTHKRQDQALRPHGPTHWPRRPARDDGAPPAPPTRDRPREPATCPPAH